MRTSLSFSGAEYLQAQQHQKRDQIKQTKLLLTRNFPFFAHLHRSTLGLSKVSYWIFPTIKKDGKNHYLCQNPCLTFHLLLQGETSMYLLQFCFHGQPADVRLQVCAVHHADAEHDERDVLRLGAHKAASPSTRTGRLAGRVGVLLLILKYHFTERLWGVTSRLCEFRFTRYIKNCFCTFTYKIGDDRCTTFFFFFIKLGKFILPLRRNGHYFIASSVTAVKYSSRINWNRRVTNRRNEWKGVYKTVIMKEVSQICRA